MWPSTPRFRKGSIYMAGSLQARAEKYAREEMPSIMPDSCPQEKTRWGIQPHCMYVYGLAEIALCPFAFAFTDHNDVTVRLSPEHITRIMDERAMAHLEVRVLCMLAKPVDRAGA